MPAPPRKTALLIGNGQFDDPDLSVLTAPRADVKALREVLLEPTIGGFDDAVVLDDAEFAEAYAAIGNLFRVRSGEDTIVLYYSGHGLPDEYDHVSQIGQPAKFAEALARMVTEQIGPRGKDAWLTGTSNGAAGAKTKHKSQWVIHGPVVYTDRLFETIVDEEDEVKRMAACLFAKPISHAAQREYRFVVLNGGAVEETVLLKISGMMRDALKPHEPGLIRPTPAPAETVGEDGAPLPRPVKSSERQEYRRATVKERKEEREERRFETRDSEGKVLSSDVKRRESVEEKIATKELETDGRGLRELRRAEEQDEARRQLPVLETEGEPDTRDGRDDEDSIAEEVALEERDWNDEHGRDEFVIPVVHQGSGRRFRSFGEMLEDPTAPMSPSAKTWEASACSAARSCTTRSRPDSIWLPNTARLRFGASSSISCFPTEIHSRFQGSPGSASSLTPGKGRTSAPASSRHVQLSRW